MSIHNSAVRSAVAATAAEKADESGDVPEFEVVAAGRWTTMVRTAYLLTGDNGLAQDLAQSTLASVYVHWGKVSRARDIDAYLHRILINTHLSRLRRRRVREVELDDRTARDATAADSATADFAAAAAWRVTVNEALAALPPRQRAVLVLRFWSDLTEVQTAVAMGCSVGTVKSQTFKALAKLRLDPALQRDLTEGQS